MAKEAKVADSSDPVNGGQLRAFVERIERLEEEKKGIGDDIKDVYSEAKATGYDAKIIRQIVRLRKMKPDHINDLVALVALYRHGPMDSIPKYIACKSGKEAPEYLHPLLEPILKETYGVMTYQDDVMRIARELGLTPVLWNVTGYDWDPIGVQGILKNLDAGIARNRRRGRSSNLLLHDGSHRGIGWHRMDTVRAVDRLLSAKQGTEPRYVTVNAWGK